MTRRRWLASSAAVRQGSRADVAAERSTAFDTAGAAPACDGTTTVVIMGVAGTGKTTVMGALAARLGWPTAEADEFHSAANVEKMRSGQPLTDADRWPWLESIAAWIGERERAGDSALVTCSALRRVYRDLLRDGHPSVWFVHLVAPEAVLEDRMEHRRGHYMPVSLLGSQLDTLEPLAPGEPGVVVRADRPLDAVVEAVIRALPDRSD